MDEEYLCCVVEFTVTQSPAKKHEDINTKLAALFEFIYFSAFGSLKDTAKIELNSFLYFESICHKV